jgi:predicted porin
MKSHGIACSNMMQKEKTRMMKISQKISLSLVMMIALSLGHSIASSNSTSSTKLTPSKDHFSLNITGKALFGSTFGSQTAKNSYIFSGPKSPIGQIYTSGTLLPTHHQGSLFDVGRSGLTFTAERTAGELKYSFVWRISGDGSSTYHMKEIYLMVETPYGSFVLGDVKGPEDRASCGPSDFCVGTGGTDGNFSRFVNMTTSCVMSPSAVGDTGSSTKASFYSKRLAGFQASIAYIPNNQHLGEMALNTAMSPLKTPFRPFDLQSVVAGIDFLQKFGDITLNLSAVHLHGNTRAEKPDVRLLQRTNTNSWDFGVVLGLGRVSLGAEYIYNGNSGKLRHDIFGKELKGIVPTVNGETLPGKYYIANQAGKFWTLNTGISYIGSEAGVSFSCLTTSRKTGITSLSQGCSSKARGSAFVLSTEYYLAPGFVPYLEWGIYKMKNPDWAYVCASIANLTQWDFIGVPSNTAKAMIAGLKIQF